jgi:hypothetical protein
MEQIKPIRDHAVQHLSRWLCPQCLGIGITTVVAAAVLKAHPEDLGAQLLSGVMGLSSALAVRIRK